MIHKVPSSSKNLERKDIHSQTLLKWWIFSSASLSLGGNPDSFYFYDLFDVDQFLKVFIESATILLLFIFWVCGQEAHKILAP